MTDAPLIRAINFHNTPRSNAIRLEQQFEHLARHFAGVTEKNLDDFLAAGQWKKTKPGLIVAVYEGYRNGYEVLRPLLERYGFIGWFFVITGFINAKRVEQLAFANAHEIDMETHEYSDGRYAMTWDELRELDHNHVVACHTRSHVPLTSLPADLREPEILGAQEDLASQLNHRVRSFVSYGGPPYGRDQLTDQWIDRAGFHFVFSNLRIQRLRPWA